MPQRIFDAGEEITIRLAAHEWNHVLSVLDNHGIHRAVRPIIDKIQQQANGSHPGAEIAAVLDPPIGAPVPPGRAKKQRTNQHDPGYEPAAISNDA